MHLLVLSLSSNLSAALRIQRVASLLEYLLICILLVDLISKRKYGIECVPTDHCKTQ